MRQSGTLNLDHYIAAILWAFKLQHVHKHFENASWYCTNCPSHNINQLNSHAALGCQLGEQNKPRLSIFPGLMLFGVQRNADENEIFLPSLPWVEPLLPTVKVMSLFIFSLADRDEWPYLRSLPSPGPASAGVLPLGHPAGHSRGDWWHRLPKCVWGSSSWSCPALRWSFPLTGRASAELLIERLRLTGLCDTSLLIQAGPETCSPLPALLSGGANENLWPL